MIVGLKKNKVNMMKSMFDKKMKVVNGIGKGMKKMFAYAAGFSGDISKWGRADLLPLGFRFDHLQYPVPLFRLGLLGGEESVRETSSGVPHAERRAANAQRGAEEAAHVCRCGAARGYDEDQVLSHL